MTVLHLYLDETGNFQQGQRSAIGGLWAPREISPEEARGFWLEVLGERLMGTFHGAEFKGDVEALLARGLAAMKRREWQPLIIEHASRETVVDNATTYVNVFAEGVCKFGCLQAARAEREVELDVTTAMRLVPRAEDPNVMDSQKLKDYESRLVERVQTERLRAPRAVGEAPWTYRLRIGSARQDPRLMMADLLCTGWSRQEKLPKDLQSEWREFLKAGSFQVLRADDAERIPQHLAHGEHSLAVMTLLTLIGQRKSLPTWLQKCRREVIQVLAMLDGDTRDAVIRAPLTRIRTEIEGNRDHATGSLLLNAWREEFITPLRQALTPEEAERLDWASAEALSLAVLIGNHRGAILETDAALADFEPLKGKLASRFERLPTVLDMRVYRAVHLSNVYDFESAFLDLERLTGILDGLLELMTDLEATETDRLRSDLLGRAMGTALQAAMMAGRRNPERYMHARALSERALREFERPEDQRRQEGYRAQLETDAGNLTEARVWLARSLGLDENAGLHAMAEAACANRFSVMHVVRLWEAAARLGDKAMCTEMAEAWKVIEKRCKIDLTTVTGHPMPIVLWKAGAALGRLGRHAQALTLIEGATRACEADPAALTVRTIGLGALCDRLAILQELNDHGKLRKGVENLRQILEAIVKPTHPEPLRCYFADWPKRVDAAAQSDDPTAWRALAWDIPY